MQQALAIAKGKKREVVAVKFASSLLCYGQRDYRLTTRPAVWMVAVRRLAAQGQGEEQGKEQDELHGRLMDFRYENAKSAQIQSTFP